MRRVEFNLRIGCLGEGKNQKSYNKVQKKAMLWGWMGVTVVLVVIGFVGYGISTKTIIKNMYLADLFDNRVIALRFPFHESTQSD